MQTCARGSARERWPELLLSAPIRFYRRDQVPRLAWFDPPRQAVVLGCMREVLTRLGKRERGPIAVTGEPGDCFVRLAKALALP
jgi:hypothetical protein